MVIKELYLEKKYSFEVSIFLNDSLKFYISYYFLTNEFSRNEHAQILYLTNQQY